jgi:hypothetical protein
MNSLCEKSIFAYIIYMRLLFLFLIFAAVITSTPSARAQNSWQQAGGYAASNPVPPDSLANGVISCSRAPLSGSALNIGTESFYLLPLPPEQAVNVVRTKLPSSPDTDSQISNPVTSDDLRKVSITDTGLKTLKNLN